MHRSDNSLFLLFIEPSKEDKKPTTDKHALRLAKMLRGLLYEAKCGTSNYSKLDSKPVFRYDGAYMGVHTTDCGERSRNFDLMLGNGMITNSLAAFYIENYWDVIPESEKKKLDQLAEFYGMSKVWEVEEKRDRLHNAVFKSLEIEEDGQKIIYTLNQNNQYVTESGKVLSDEDKDVIFSRFFAVG